ncbi:hypothetical protein E4U42_003907 [Claviceps africana]|uniref:Uncharacterized protein n=1 Tax=Claviceps africana TaxID=83212 RepID=A0A8K0J690_9HYPO|nr:hypothetical protein E4U42_003907 [Claviceps africana]
MLIPEYDCELGHSTVIKSPAAVMFSGGHLVRFIYPKSRDEESKSTMQAITFSTIRFNYASAGVGLPSLEYKKTVR